MNWPHVVDPALQSLVLAVLITSLVGLFVGQQVIRAKDEQIKTKDDQIATLKEAHAAELRVKDEQITALERWLPAKP